MLRDYSGWFGRYRCSVFLRANKKNQSVGQTDWLSRRKERYFFCVDLSLSNFDANLWQGSKMAVHKSFARAAGKREPVFSP
jgi:hypothetical protein